MAAPFLQLRFLSRSGSTWSLKRARARFTAGMIVTPLGGLAVLTTSSVGAHAAAQAVAWVGLLAGALGLLTGPRTLVDVRRRRLLPHRGEALAAEEVEALALEVELGLGEGGLQEWGSLYALPRGGGRPVLLGQSLRPEQLRDRGRELAELLSVEWREGDESLGEREG